MLTREEIRRTALEQSAEDHGCSPGDFEAAEHRFFVSAVRRNARVYLRQPAVLDVTSYGPNAVVTCRPELTDDLRAMFGREPEFWQLFAPEGIAAMDRLLAPLGARMSYATLSFLPDPDEVARFDGTCPYPVRPLGPADFAGLYRPEWSDALCEKRKKLDVIGAGAYDGDTLVGLAGASADCASMLQIGVNVLPGYRGKGIGAVLVNRLAAAILARDLVPFYSAVWANVRSVGTAVRAGFRPAWAGVSAAAADTPQTVFSSEPF